MKICAVWKYDKSRVCIHTARRLKRLYEKERCDGMTEEEGKTEMPPGCVYSFTARKRLLYINTKAWNVLKCRGGGWTEGFLWSFSVKRRGREKKENIRLPTNSVHLERRSLFVVCHTEWGSILFRTLPLSLSLSHSLSPALVFFLRRSLLAVYLHSQCKKLGPNVSARTPSQRLHHREVTKSNGGWHSWQRRRGQMSPLTTSTKRKKRRKKIAKINYKPAVFALKL